jgi:autonomous glycyl radical cofactor GrcA
MIFNQLTGLIFNAFAYPTFRYSFILFPFFGIIIGSVWENVIIKKKISVIGLTLSFIISLYVWIYSYNVLLDYKIKYIWILLIELILGFVTLYLMKFNSKYLSIYKAIFIFLIVASTSIDHYITTNFRLVVNQNDYPLVWNRSELLGDTAEAIKWIKNNDNFNKLVYLFETYFKNGGTHFQLTYVSKEDLIAAQKTPDHYKNLRVRVSGFSDYFVFLNEGLQNEIISRTKHSSWR